MADFTRLAKWTASSPSCHLKKKKTNSVRHVSLCQLCGGVAPVGRTRGLMHARAHVLQHMSYTPAGAWLAGTTHYRQGPSWSSSSAGNWPCCTWNCSRKHLQTSGHTKVCKFKRNLLQCSEEQGHMSHVLEKTWMRNRDDCTLMATGYMVPPISKLPFLNIMTDVLLTQVPAETIRWQIRGDWLVWALSKPTWSGCSVVTLSPGTELT